MNSPRVLLSVSVALSVTVAVGCGETSGGAGQGGEAAIPVVATTTQVADLTRNVGGDRVEVRGFLGPNVDPHDYEPRPSDAQAVTDARVVFKSGGDLDAWLSEVTESAGTGAPVVELIDRVETIEGGDAHGEEHGGEEEHAGGEEEHGSEEEAGVDPHWWHDPRNAQRAVEAIRTELVRVDPAGATDYERNASDYLERLRRLDQQVADCMNRVPADQRKLVTTHDALGYFADRYDVEAIGSVLDSLSTEAQPSAGDTRELIDQIREEDVRAVFAESSVDTRLEGAIAEETQAQVGAPLYADTLGPEGSPGATYVGSVAANADAMARGFTGGTVTCGASPAA